MGTFSSLLETTQTSLRPTRPPPLPSASSLRSRCCPKNSHTKEYTSRMSGDTTLTHTTGSHYEYTPRKKSFDNI